MTVAESIIGGFILAILTGLLGMVLGGKKKVSEEEFSAHIQSRYPHIDCPVHETKLGVIEKKIDRMDEKLDRLLEP